MQQHCQEIPARCRQIQGAYLKSHHIPFAVQAHKQQVLQQRKQEQPPSALGRESAPDAEPCARHCHRSLQDIIYLACLRVRDAAHCQIDAQRQIRRPDSRRFRVAGIQDIPGPRAAPCQQDPCRLPLRPQPVARIHRRDQPKHRQGHGQLYPPYRQKRSHIFLIPLPPFSAWYAAHPTHFPKQSVPPAGDAVPVKNPFYRPGL